MANEAVVINRVTIPISVTCADGTGIEQGTVLKFADPNTVSASTGTSDIVAGIAYNEKIASDGNTQIAVLQGPGDILIMRASGNITTGDPVGTLTGYPNYVVSLYLTGNLSRQQRLGFARETATNGETLKVELNRGIGM